MQSDSRDNKKIYLKRDEGMRYGKFITGGKSEKKVAVGKSEASS